MEIALSRSLFALPLAAALLVMSPPAPAQPDLEALARQVADAERAFARSMADRKLDDFARHVSEQAVFFGPQGTLRGKAAVVAGWKAFYDGAKAPFSWSPDHVIVLADGRLAHSTGLVRDPEGKVAARFNSVWQLEADGVWRVVFDKGSPATEAERKQN